MVLILVIVVVVLLGSGYRLRKTDSRSRWFRR
jgi:hypothetical protein